MLTAYSIRVRGVVQGVGFRPFVYRIAHSLGLFGWVLNGEQGVEIHVEGPKPDLESFVDEMRIHPPAAAQVSVVEIETVAVQSFRGFSIRESQRNERPTVRISHDLPVCSDCLNELFNPADRRYLYPYINCTNCGPRYSVVLALPYDRPNTTMRSWPLDASCYAEYHNPADRRFHAQPIACPGCGPGFHLCEQGETIAETQQAIRRAAQLLHEGKIVAVKGLGGYHLACDAFNASANAALRERKFRKEKPFAVMARNLDVARTLVTLSPQAEQLITSIAHPIVLAPARINLPGVAPDNDDLGVMLPYTPLQHLLFAAGAPEALVMTSANRSSEPIAFEEEDALESLNGIADAFLIGERPIARRVDDSVIHDGAFGPVILRRARGYAPGAVASLPTNRPILALGADLKNTITLVVDGQAFVSQHIGDLDHFHAFRAFQETISDLVSMYEINWNDLLLVHDSHPQYASTMYASELNAQQSVAMQHHRAHIASALAERGEWQTRVVGVSFDGTGYGDDGSIWGGEFFVGSVSEGFERVAHLRSAALPGGDAAARFPVQAAAGFLAQLDPLPDMTATPFNFPARFNMAVELVTKGVRTFPTTSIGRLFDAVAALLGFTREISFEGQAAMWLEHLARSVTHAEAYAFPFIGSELDFRPLLQSVISDRQRGRDIREIARAFHLSLATTLRDCVVDLCRAHRLNAAVLSGGVFQNELLLSQIHSLFQQTSIHVWTNHAVPPNDGGISLGQATLAAFAASAASESATMVCASREEAKENPDA
ncbi:carbamoyltransferase HypF [Acidicapsa acidisoli]|uniref:carbamoyltransferase HypF n=1 Tax=Acidicapsa acidisoli TaxID=1615681 RepID=UPI0021DFDEE1|nr:carbamoyltransferase HypF [Acidicapsa acidisoli]